MLKLLLDTKKKEIKQQYLLRYITVLLYALFLVVLLYGFSLFPSFLTSYTQNKAIKTQLEVVKDPVYYQERLELKRSAVLANQKMELFDLNTYQPTNIIGNITAQQSAGVTISSIAFVSEKEATTQVYNGSVVIQGRATDREALAQFVAGLEEVEQFVDVDLPFSSFTQKENIPFSMTITVAAPQHKEQAS